MWKQLFIKIKVAKNSIILYFNWSGIIIILCLRSVNRVGIWSVYIYILSFSLIFWSCTFLLHYYVKQRWPSLYYFSTLYLLFLKPHNGRFLLLLIFTNSYRHCTMVWRWVIPFTWIHNLLEPTKCSSGDELHQSILSIYLQCLNSYNSSRRWLWNCTLVHLLQLNLYSYDLILKSVYVCLHFSQLGMAPCMVTVYGIFDKY